MGFALFIVLAVAGFAVSAYLRSVARSEWARARMALGLNQAPSAKRSRWWIGGQIRGIHVDVRIVHRGSGKNRTTYTRYEVTHPSVGPDVRLTRQGTTSFLRKLVGGRDVVIGDPRFDDSVVIDTDDPAAVAAFLSPARKAAVLTIFQLWRGAEIGNRIIAVETRGLQRSGDTIVATVNRLVDTALVMSAPAAVDHALELQEHGDLATGVAELHAVNEAAPNSFTSLLEAQGLVALGEREAAAAIVGDLETVPEDGEVAGLRELTHRPPPAPPQVRQVPQIAPAPAPEVVHEAPPAPEALPVSEAVPVSEPEPTPAAAPASPRVPEVATATPAPDVDLSQDAVIDDLFGSDRMGFEIADHFQAPT